LVNNHLAQYVTMQMSTLHFHFNPTFIHSLSFQTKLGGQGFIGWETWSVSSSKPKQKNIKKKSLFYNLKILTLKPYKYRVQNRMQVLQNIKSHNQIQLLQTLIVFKYCNKNILTRKIPHLPSNDIIKL
jgi:hypothetical protein